MRTQLRAIGRAGKERFVREFTAGSIGMHAIADFM
jgi:hypothetical protein